MIRQHRSGGLGDKETFLYGCLATQSKYYMISHPTGVSGWFEQSWWARWFSEPQFCGLAMIQVWIHQNCFSNYLLRLYHTVRL